MVVVVVDTPERGTTPPVMIDSAIALNHELRCADFWKPPKGGVAPFRSSLNRGSEKDKGDVRV